MAPVDGITPPPKNKRKKPASTKTDNNTVTKKITKPRKQTKITKPAVDNDKNTLPDKQKHGLIWILSVIIVIIIFIVWINSFSGIQQSQEDGDKNFLETFSSELANTWNTFKSDWLKIQQDSEEAPETEEERIQKLEEKVFPSFDQNN